MAERTGIQVDWSAQGEMMGGGEVPGMLDITSLCCFLSVGGWYTCGFGFGFGLLKDNFADITHHNSLDEKTYEN